MVLASPRFCPACGKRARFVWSVGNVLRLIADIPLALVGGLLFLMFLFDLWFRCPECGTEFKAE